ncbi:MAG: hypothetical protein LBH00_07030 [Planctomycetaceae bacterium]|jgi:hypothetical protein|nr:hypothetical protein [Planctomycetaceae bacterium]
MVFVIIFSTRQFFRTSIHHNKINNDNVAENVILYFLFPVDIRRRGTGRALNICMSESIIRQCRRKAVDLPFTLYYQSYSHADFAEFRKTERRNADIPVHH